jgi:DNA-binding transcriptional ArsR family regulator
VFELLAEGATSVGKLASHVEVSRPAVSQHLRVLKAAGLVNATAKGTLRVYRVEPDGLEALRAYLLELVERAAASAL